MRNHHSTPDISLVIPLYNEGPNLTPLYESTRKILDTLHYSWELIFVDDGSTDGGPEVLRGIADKDPAVRVLTFERNAGQSAAFHAGIRKARGALVITMDADLQNDPSDIPGLLQVMEEGDCELVCGWRQKRNDPWVKRISSRVANFIRNRLTHESIHDTGCSLKVFKKDALNQINFFNGMHRFFPTLMKMHGFKVREAAVNHRHRRFGQSKYNISNRAWRSFVDLLAVRWMQDRFLRYKIKE